MDILTDEHRMLRDSLDGRLADLSGPHEIWSAFTEMGLLGLSLPESDGGLGLGLTELLIVCHALGRAGMTSPFLGSETLAGPIFAALSHHDAVRPLFDGIVAGKIIVTFAPDGEVSARTDATGSVHLDGLATVVPAAMDAGFAIVDVTLNGLPALVLLDLGAEGVERRTYHTKMVGENADLNFTDVVLPSTAILAEGDAATAMLNKTRAMGQLAICAEMFGAMEILLEQTCDYLRTRRQFGQPLASFQVLQHAAVDMFVELETAKGMLTYGQLAFEAGRLSQTEIYDAVKFKMNAAAKLVGETAVQLHGATGMTQENLTGRLFSRLTQLRLEFGDSRTCMNRLLAEDVSIALG